MFCGELGVEREVDGDIIWMMDQLAHGQLKLINSQMFFAFAAQP